MPGYQSFLALLQHFILAKLASTSIRVKDDLSFGCIRNHLGIVYEMMHSSNVLHGLLSLIKLSVIRKPSKISTGIFRSWN